jgi:hypothetical protein
LAGLVASEPALRNARTVTGPTGATLVRPARYVILAPLSDTLDALSLLSVPQLIALTASIMVYFGLWRIVRARLRGTTAWCEFCAGLRFLLVYVLLIMFAAVLPRPMAALRTDDPDAVVFDIHSHTNFSHDARSTFTVEENRAWHHAAGFDVAYITDHRCFDGAAQGMRANPKRAGDGTVLLSGIELPGDQRHEVVLEPPTARVVAGLLESWCVRAKTGQPLSLPPVRIQTIPEDLSRIRPALQAGDSGVVAIEISDGAPRGLAQTDHDGDSLLILAGRFHLAGVAGSNNHGWGRTAVAWNVMRVPGWRSLTPDSLGAVIEMRLRAERQNSVRVIERRRPDSFGDPFRAAISYPFMPFELVPLIFGSISLAEGISWLVWAWGIAGIVFLVRRRRA